MKHRFVRVGSHNEMSPRKRMISKVRLDVAFPCHLNFSDRWLPYDPFCQFWIAGMHLDFMHLPIKSPAGFSSIIALTVIVGLSIVRGAYQNKVVENIERKIEQYIPVNGVVADQELPTDFLFDPETRYRPRSPKEKSIGIRRWPRATRRDITQG